MPTISPTFSISSISLNHTSIAFSRNHSFNLISAPSSSRFTSTFEHNHHKIKRSHARAPERACVRARVRACVVCGQSVAYPGKEFVCVYDQITGQTIFSGSID